MLREQMFPEKSYEDEYPYLETDFVTAKCTEDQYKMKLLNKELSTHPDPNGTIDLGSLYDKYGDYEKYTERNKETAALQQELVEACGSGDKEKIEELKKTYQTRFPDQIGEVLTLFSFPEFLDNQQIKNSLYKNKDSLVDEVNELKTQRDAAKDPAEFDKLTKIIKEKCAEVRVIDAQGVGKIQELAAYQNRTANLVKANFRQRDLLSGFWSLQRDIAAAKDGIKRTSCNEKLPPDSHSITMEMTKAAILGQVAATRAFEKSGYNVTNPTPEEDAELGADIWISGKSLATKVPVQIMARPKGEKFQIKKISVRGKQRESKSGEKQKNNQSEQNKASEPQNSNQKVETVILEGPDSGAPKQNAERQKMQAEIPEQNNISKIQNSIPGEKNTGATLEQNNSQPAQIDPEDVRKSKPEHVRHNIFAKKNIFEKSVAAFAETNNIDYMEGFIVYVPRDMIDPINGDPDESIELETGNELERLSGDRQPPAKSPAPAAEAAS